MYVKINISSQNEDLNKEKIPQIHHTNPLASLHYRKNNAKHVNINLVAKITA